MSPYYENLFNQCQCALIDPTSDRDLANVVLLAVVDDPVFMDRERRAIRWRTFGGEHQLTGSVLESESHLVDALADDHADTTRDDRKSTRLNSSHLGISY